MIGLHTQSLFDLFDFQCIDSYVVVVIIVTDNDFDDHHHH